MMAYLLVACVLIAGSIAALVCGQFRSVEDSETVATASIPPTATEPETVNAPVWAGVGAIALDIGLLPTPLIKR